MEMKKSNVSDEASPLDNNGQRKENLLTLAQESRRESWVSISSSRRNSRVLQNDLLLHEAVIKNEPEEVEKILKEQVDVNSRNNYGRAPIHWASSRGSTEIMEMLINAKCDFEAQDKFGMRPLMMAAWHGHEEAVKFLIRHGADVSAVNKKQYTLLMCAAKNNRVGVIDVLVELLGDLKANEMDIEKQTAVHHAAAGGHVEALKKLLELGAFIDVTDKDNKTALHLAAEKGHVEVAEYLVQKKANVNATDKDGSSPLHIATENKQTRLAQLLLESGTNPNLANEKGLMPLHIACDLSCRGIIDSLLEHGANINAQTKTGNTPLHLACKNNEPEIVQLLISKGANVNLFNVRLESPIIVAAENGWEDICKILMASGANVQNKEKEGITPLYMAARGSFTAIIDMIIKTARLDYFSPEYDYTIEVKENALKKIGKHWRQPKGNKISNTLDHNENLRSLFYKIAYKQLSQGEWKKLALYWAFTQEQIKAIEHQYTGSSGYKEHGFRVMLIWAHGLEPEVNPVEELYESLVAVGNKKAADVLKKNLDKERESRSRFGTNFLSCSIL